MITEVVRTGLIIDDEFLGEFWTADQPDGRVFACDGSMSREDAQSLYEFCVEQESV